MPPVGAITNTVQVTVENKVARGPRPSHRPSVTDNALVPSVYHKGCFLSSPKDGVPPHLT